MNGDQLAAARDLASTVFRPLAEQTDQGDVNGQLRENVGLLRAAGYFGLGIPRAYGGMEADDVIRQEYSELLASACGVTSFTQQQLQSGGGFLTSTENTALKSALLPSMARGDILCSIGFSHLRRPGLPVVTARVVQGGYLITGTLPWVTGWSLLDSYVLGATLSEGDRHLYLYVDIDRKGSSYRVTPAPRLVCMNASDTVEVEYIDHFVPTDHLLFDKPASDMVRADFSGITGHVQQPLGCATGSVIYLRSLAEQRGRQDIAKIADKFELEIIRFRQEALNWNSSRSEDDDYRKNALKVRTGTIFLAVRAAHAAIAASGGSAHYMSRPPQRLMREALFYTTVAQTRDVQSEMLDLLVAQNGANNF